MKHFPINVQRNSWYIATFFSTFAAELFSKSLYEEISDICMYDACHHEHGKRPPTDKPRDLCRRS